MYLPLSLISITIHALHGKTALCVLPLTLCQLGDSPQITDHLFGFYRMIQPQTSRDVVDGGSVHVWLDLTSKMQTLLRSHIVKSNFKKNQTL